MLFKKRGSWKSGVQTIPRAPSVEEMKELILLRRLYYSKFPEPISTIHTQYSEDVAKSLLKKRLIRKETIPVFRDGRMEAYFLTKKGKKNLLSLAEKR